MIKNGCTRSHFHHVFSDHSVLLQNWICSNKNCKHTVNPSIKSVLGFSIHTDLQKLYAELGATESYGKSERILTAFSAGKRRVNNRQRIHGMIQRLGEKVPELREEMTLPTATADVLLAQVDGGYLHDWEKRGTNYEVMVGKIYKPEAIKNTNEQRRMILEKTCSASAKKDKQITMKKRFLKSAKLQGLSANTKVTALSDGARNCWNILRVLEGHCLSITYILDWFHIAKKMKTLENCLPSFVKIPLGEIKGFLWKGKTQEALSHILSLNRYVKIEKDLQRVNDFYNYIARNADYVVNYNDRHHANLPYTTHVVESTVEHLLNSRWRKKQKMQWSRKGADNILQIRASMASNEWPSTWNKIIQKDDRLVA